MKKFLVSIFAVCALAVSAIPVFAGEARVTLHWTPRPASENVTSYVVSELLSPGRTVIGVTHGTSFAINNVPNGEHFYVVTAINALGEGIPGVPFRVNVFSQPFGSPGIINGLTGDVFYTFP